MESKFGTHKISIALFCVGGVLCFIGFVFPGWLWLLNTPGDVEMLPLVAITLVGFAGVVTLVIAGIRRVAESRQSNPAQKIKD
ncbi:MAG TPA: hypothetical protein V6C89_07630 [Drouetiella sp.]|jgi:hypothetical protein